MAPKPKKQPPSTRAKVETKTATKKTLPVAEVSTPKNSIIDLNVNAWGGFLAKLCRQVAWENEAADEVHRESGRKWPEGCRKPPSSFVTFMNMMRPILKSLYPQDKPQTIMKAGSRLWDAIPEADKQPFLDRVKSLKKQYDVKKAAEDAKKGPVKNVFAPPVVNLDGPRWTRGKERKRKMSSP